MRQLLGDREGQRLAVAAAIATEVSGEVGRSVHDNLGGTGRRDLGRGNRGFHNLKSLLYPPETFFILPLRNVMRFGIRDGVEDK